MLLLSSSVFTEPIKVYVKDEQIATYPPNVKYIDDFTKIQEEARKNNKGFWLENWTIQDELEATICDNLRVRPREESRLTIKGTPGVEYKINVYYSSGSNKAQGLEPKVADNGDNVSWIWMVGLRTKPGKYKIVILGDKTFEYEIKVY